MYWNWHSLFQLHRTCTQTCLVKAWREKVSIRQISYDLKSSSDLNLTTFHLLPLFWQISARNKILLKFSPTFWLARYEAKRIESVTDFVAKQWAQLRSEKRCYTASEEGRMKCWGGWVSILRHRSWRAPHMPVLDLTFGEGREQIWNMMQAEEISYGKFSDSSKVILWCNFFF